MNPSIDTGTGRGKQVQNNSERVLEIDDPIIKAFSLERDHNAPALRRIHVPDGKGFLSVSYEGGCVIPGTQTNERHLLTQYSAIVGVGPITMVVAYTRGPSQWLEYEWNAEHIRGFASWVHRTNAPTEDNGVLAGTHLLTLDPRHAATLERMRSEVETPGVCTAPFLLGSLMDISSDVLCALPKTVLSYVSADLSEGIRNLLDEIRANPVRTWSLKEAADFAGYSAFHLSRAFRQHMPYGFPDFVMRCRTERAAKLVLESDLPIDRISRDCGYGSAQAMREAFRSYVGLLPSELRSLAIYIA